MTGSPDPTDGTEETVGSALARWRRRKKISGQALGDLVGLSQPTISRLETGTSNPDPHDVRRIAEALELPADEISRLVSLAERSGDQIIDWQTPETGITNMQQLMRQIEAPAREIRTFQPALVVGLLQTSEYARAVLMGFEAGIAGRKPEESKLAVSEAVAARIQRSQLLYEAHRRFHFVMTESVLRNRVCRPEDMLGQITRLREVAEMPNVSIKIITDDAQWPVAPLHGFELMDDRCAIVDLMNVSQLSRLRYTVRRYRTIFDSFEAIATAEIGPVLDRYHSYYMQRLHGATV